MITSYEFVRSKTIGILTRTEMRSDTISYEGKAWCNTKDSVRTSFVTHPVICPNWAWAEFHTPT